MVPSLIVEPGTFQPLRWLSAIKWSGAIKWSSAINSWASNRCDEAFRSATREYEVDPKRAFGLDFSEVELETVDGVGLRAWFVPGGDDASRRTTAAAVVHHHFAGQKATTLDWIRHLHRWGLMS